MNNLEKILLLNSILLQEMPRYKESAKQFAKTEEEQSRLLRSLMNVREPTSLDEKFIALQDEVLSAQVEEKGTVALCDLKPLQNNNKQYLWKGDITTLQVGAIVNAANSALLGCFIPCHGCIDNAIHSLAGLQLRGECYDIIKNQGHEEDVGDAKITGAYNLPCDFVIHTVGPNIHGKLTKKDCELLQKAYYSCMKLAIDKKIKSIAFCCVSTGEFHFPNDKAAEIAVDTVTKMQKNVDIEVVFNVFKEEDYKLYRNLLGQDC